MQKKPNTAKKYKIITQCVQDSGEPYHEVQLVRKLHLFQAGYVFVTASTKNLSQIGDAKGYLRYRLLPDSMNRSVIMGGTPSASYSSISYRHTLRYLKCHNHGCLTVRGITLRQGIMRYFRS